METGDIAKKSFANENVVLIRLMAKSLAKQSEFAQAVGSVGSSSGNDWLLKWLK